MSVATYDRDYLQQTSPEPDTVHNNQLKLLCTEAIACMITTAQTSILLSLNAEKTADRAAAAGEALAPTVLSARSDNSNRTAIAVDRIFKMNGQKWKTALSPFGPGPRPVSRFRKVPDHSPTHRLLTVCSDLNVRSERCQQKIGPRPQRKSHRHRDERHRHGVAGPHLLPHDAQSGQTRHKHRHDKTEHYELVRGHE